MLTFEDTKCQEPCYNRTQERVLLNHIEFNMPNTAAGRKPALGYYMVIITEPTVIDCS